MSFGADLNLGMEKVLDLDKIDLGGAGPRRFYPTKPIRQMEHDDKELDSVIASNRPVLIKNSNLVQSALPKWSNMEYLRTNWQNAKFHVVRSANSRFMYWDEKKLMNVRGFKPPTAYLDMTFDDFLDKLKSLESQSPPHRYYLQQQLNVSVGKELVEDFKRFNWPWIGQRQKACKWGELTSNLLLIGQPGNVTPCHYDEQENFFAQIKGRKRCILFSPEMFDALYTYPIYHPADRQSQVDLYQEPDLTCFPNLKKLEGFETIVEPGDVLYIPSYWFHQIEILDDGSPDVSKGPDDLNVSVNFWYKITAPASNIVYPLKPDQKVAMTRNIEKIVLQALDDPAELPAFFNTLTLGRYYKFESK